MKTCEEQRKEMPAARTARPAVHTTLAAFSIGLWLLPITVLCTGCKTDPGSESTHLITNHLFIEDGNVVELPTCDE